jgi:hypothetical protein
MALHYHVISAAPHVITGTGTVRPYPVMEGPPKVAHALLDAFKRALIPALSPAVMQEPQPEEIARMAKRYADAMAAGMRPPAGTDERLLRAAHMINQGQPFVIKSAGRAAVVRSQGPASITAIRSQSSAAGPVASDADAEAPPPVGRTVSMSY